MQLIWLLILIFATQAEAALPLSDDILDGESKAKEPGPDMNASFSYKGLNSNDTQHFERLISEECVGMEVHICDSSPCNGQSKATGTTTMSLVEVHSLESIVGVPKSRLELV